MGLGVAIEHVAGLAVGRQFAMISGTRRGIPSELVTALVLTGAAVGLVTGSGVRCAGG